MQLLTTVHDPDAIFLPSYKNLSTELKKYGSVVAAVSPATSTKIRNFLETELDWQTITGGLWGEARIAALKWGLENSQENMFFYTDHDRLLHWVKYFPKELENIFSKDSEIQQKLTSTRLQLAIPGRTTQAFYSHPQSWWRTESIINELLAKIVGEEIDPYAGSYAINRSLAKEIVHDLEEKEVASVSELVLAAHEAEAEITNYRFQGLEWEDPDRFEEEITKFPRYSKWLDWRYGGPSEWKKRINSINMNMNFLAEKYPVYFEKLDNTKIQS